MKRFYAMAFTVCICFIAIMVSAPVNADMLYSQELLTGSTGPTSQGAQLVADDFVLGQDASITDLHWWGYYGNFDGASSDDFIIRFYEDDGTNKPQLTPFYTATAEDLIGLVRTDSGLSTPTDPALTIYRYDTFLSTPVSVVKDTTYYASIYNDISGSTWGWSNIVTSGESSFWKPSDDTATDNYWRTVGGKNLAFELTSDAVAPVPEPTTMLLFGTGLAGLAGSCLRRKKK